MLKKFANFFQKDSGAIVPIAGIILPAIMLVTAMSIDTARLSNLRYQARAYADSAAMNAMIKVRQLIDEKKTQYLNPGDIESDARNAFLQFAEEEGLDVTAAEASFYQDKENYYIDLDYSLQTNRFLGNNPYILNNVVTATTNFAKASAYMDFHLLVDMSGSMSTGATAAAQVALWKEDGCNFACHATNINKARAQNIPLRQDKLASALRSLGSVAKKTLNQYGLHNNSAKFNIWKYNTEVKSGGRTTNLQTFMKHADDLLKTKPSGHTNISGALSHVLKYKLPASGDGFSENSRRTFVFLITDGMSDNGTLLNKSKNGRGTLDPQLCDQIRATGATVAVIYTKYVNYSETYKSAWGWGTSNIGEHGAGDYSHWKSHYDDHVSLPLNHMENVLKSCADEDFYFETNSGNDLEMALEELYKSSVEKTISVPRIIR